MARASHMNDDEDKETHDARLDGYKDDGTVAMPSSSTAFTYIVSGILGVMFISVMFMNAKRSHLD